MGRMIWPNDVATKYVQNLYPGVFHALRKEMWPQNQAWVEVQQCIYHALFQVFNSSLGHISNVAESEAFLEAVTPKVVQTYIDGLVQGNAGSFEAVDWALYWNLLHHFPDSKAWDETQALEMGVFWGAMNCLTSMWMLSTNEEGDAPKVQKAMKTYLATHRSN